MTKAERIKIALKGERPDTIPYSIWSHFPSVDMDAKALAENTYEFYKKYDVDFIKTMNNGMYPIEDFDCEVDYSEIEKGGVAKLISTPVHEIDDWDKIEEKSLDSMALSRELHSLSLLMEKLDGEDVPVVFTLFSPLTTADKLSNKQLENHIKQGGAEKIHKALDNIANTTINLGKEAIKRGAAGVFFATQLADYASTSEEIYEEFGKPYDLKVLNSIGDAWFNVLHAHGDDIMLDILKDYPVHAFNWHIWESLPGLGEGYELVNKCIVGGLARGDITTKNKNKIRNKIYECLKTTDGKGLILTPGCVIRYPLEEDVLSYVKNIKLAVENKLFG